MHKHKHVRKSSLPGLEIIKVFDINIDRRIDMLIEMGKVLLEKVLFKITNFPATFFIIEKRK